MNQTSPIARGVLQLTVDADPGGAFRAELGQRINAFHSETVPFHATRFTLRLLDTQSRLVGGLSGAISWQWLFIEALWVDPVLRGQGTGRTLMTHAEAHAVTQGCHSAWLDTFQAREFYEALGYQAFGTLEDYPPGQSRSFMRKRLLPSVAPG